MSLRSDRSASGASTGGIIEAFEAALQRGEQPPIADYLSHPDDTATLVELLHVELKFKLRTGVEASVAEYLASYPQLAADREAVVDLIEAEFEFRRRREPSLTRGDFLARYPEFAADLLASAQTDDVGAQFSGPKERPMQSYESREVEAGVVIAGRYTLVERLGEGGMGEVWVAKQTEPVKRNVAVKLIKSGMDSRGVVQRFEQERQALALMDHPNIAKVFDGGLTEYRRPFFVMELVNGLSLTKFCDEAKLDIRDRLKIFVDVCQAVQHAHQKGVVHRDLKPLNILVTLFDGKPVPKVIDFGVAKAIGGKLTDESFSTQFGAVVGTLEYMAPEQSGFSATDVDTRADIYSLGVILYELLTGLRPIDSKRLRRAAFDETIRMIREEEPSRPSTRLSTDESRASLAALRQIEPGRLTKLLRGDLDCVVMKCLEKQRDRRYETADGLARDVRRFLADEMVEARPPSAAYRLRKFVWRNKHSVVAAALVFLAILGGVAGTAWGLLRAERARVQADLDRRTAEIKEKTAVQLTDYLVRTFQSADPIGLDAAGFHGPGDRSEERTARRMLDRGAEIVREYLDDQPLVRASLLDAMGNSYRNLAVWDVAHDRLREAHDLRRLHLGDDHADTVTSLQSLAHLARDRGDYVEADRIYRDVIARREKSYTADNLLVAETKAYLAWMTFYRPLSSEGPQFDQARLAEAERLLVDVLKVREARLPKNHRDIGYTLASLASVKISQPKQELVALAYLSRAAEIFQTNDKDTLLGNVVVELMKAELDRNSGRFDKAEAGYVKVLNLLRRHLGNRHPLVMLQMGNLAGLYRKKGDWGKTEQTAKELLELLRTMPVLRSQSAAVNGMMQYADEVRTRRSAAEAESLYREALQYARERPQGNEKNIEALEGRLAELLKQVTPKK